MNIETHAQIPTSISGTLFRLYGKQITTEDKNHKILEMLLLQTLVSGKKTPENSTDTYFKKVSTLFSAGCVEKGVKLMM